MARSAKPIGTIGSWFAKVGDEALPCVHKHWFKRLRYDDPGLIVGNKKHDEFVQALSNVKKAILTDDEIIEELDRGVSFRRKDYISLWTIGDVIFDHRGLKFQFVDKIAEF